jgi:cytochrome c5
MNPFLGSRISVKASWIFRCAILVAAVAGLAACAMAHSEPALSPPVPTMTATPDRESWLILPDFPPTATQADVGAEIYRLVCQDCHGSRGQGLTADWRAEWAPEHQNCWQARCHAPGHPPEGFLLPRYVPPLLGPGSLARFETLLDLYDYVRTTMPWHNPGSLLEAEYWQITAYLARERRLIQGDAVLDEAQAATIWLSGPQ